MASRPSPDLPRAHASTSPTAASVGATHVNNLLKNYSHEQVVYALMSQLREKETELTSLSEQSHVILRHHQITEESNKQLKSKIDVHNKLAAEKDTRIAVLEKKLAHQKKNRGSEALAEAKMKAIAEIAAESKLMLKERDDELAHLKPVLRDLKALVDEYEKNADVQAFAQLEEDLVKIELELATAKKENLESISSIEELEKKSKGKEWVIKSLKMDSNDQRSRENHLLSHIKALNEKIDTYETEFKGKGTDVPILLAKLKDYEVRVKDLQGQVRRLTNKKLNELVLRSSPLPSKAHQIPEEPTVTASLTTSRSKLLQDEEDNESKASENSFSLVNSEQFDEDDATFASYVSDDIDQFLSQSIQDEDTFGDFLTDVKVGIESLQTEGLCCMQTPMPNDMTSPLSGLSPTSYSTSQERSPRSYNVSNSNSLSQTFTSASRSDV